MKKILLVVPVMLVLLMTGAYAQKPVVVTDNDPGWHKIGKITASFKMQEESIIVYGRDEFTKIKLKVIDAPINIEKVHLFFEEGTSQEVDVRSEMQAGAETRVIDLDGTHKELQKVSFTYRTLPNYQGEKATVELYGLKTRQDRSDAFRDDKDNGNEAEKEINEESRELKEESREVRDEMKEESREARDKMKEEAHDAKHEWKEEKHEAKEELKEEKQQAKEEAREAEKNVETGAEKVGDDVSEAAVNAASHIKDKVYVDKVGPKGQIVYIDKHSKYYYVSDEGKKIYVKKYELKDKPQD